MKRDFLRNLGIEDKDIIDKILDENSSDIGKVKGEIDTLKTKITDLETEVTNKNAEITTLQTKANRVDTLTEQVTQLTNDKTQLTNDLNTKVAQMQKDHAIEGGLRDRNAKNVKAVMALLEMDKITFENGELKGLTEQLDALEKGEDTGFLFGTKGANAPSGTTPNNPPTGSGTTPSTSINFREAVAKALSTKTN